MAVDTVPAGYPVLPIIATERANEVLVFLTRVFDAELVDRYDRPDGEPAYITARIGDSVLSLMPPLEATGPTRSAFYVYVRDVDAVYQRAIEAGATSLQEPADQAHGDRMFTIVDALGNQWTVAARFEQISKEELHKRLDQGQAQADGEP